MIRKSGYRFSEKIMLKQRIERDDDSKKSHPALDFSSEADSGLSHPHAALAGADASPFVIIRQQTS
jgi:hypothetical protein